MPNYEKIDLYKNKQFKNAKYLQSLSESGYPGFEDKQDGLSFRPPSRNPSSIN
jgi:hypothetical protein